MKFEGLQDKEIADKLNISCRTVRFHSEQLFRKLKVARGTIELLSKFGSFKMQPVWVPNPGAPDIRVVRNAGWGEGK